MKLMPGDEISYVVSYLAMDASPNFGWPEKPPGDVFVLHSRKPSSRYFFDLYAAVGAAYEWTDQYEVPIREIERFLSNSSVRMFSFFKDGWTAGFFILDSRRKGVCDISYFGLVPEAIGFGYGEYLLRFAVKESWKIKDVGLLTVNTNTLDHPSALPLYKKVGFDIVQSKTEIRKLTQPRWIKNNKN